MIPEKQDVLLPWIELQDLLMYFNTVGDEKAVAMLRGLKGVEQIGYARYTKEPHPYLLIERPDRPGHWRKRVYRVLIVKAGEE